jgi:hypothetical protein
MKIAYELDIQRYYRLHKTLIETILKNESTDETDIILTIIIL